MGFSYNPLWKQLIDKGLSKEEYRLMIKTSPATIAKMGKNENVSLDVIDRTCRSLECRVEDVIEFDPTIHKEQKN